MDQIPETSLDYLMMNTCRRVIESRTGTDPTVEITRDLIASEITKNVIANTSLGEDDTESGIRLVVDELVARACPMIMMAATINGARLRVILRW